MTSPDDFWWADPQLKQRLATDPVGYLREEYGLNLPDGLPREIAHDIIRVTSLLWTDGKIMPRRGFYIDPDDEGVLFGKGVWESTKTINSIPWLWAEHIERLLHTAKLLGIKVDPSRLPSSELVSLFVRTLATTDLVIRLNVTAGRVGKPGAVWMTAAVQPEPTTQFRLKTLRSPIQPGQPYQTWKTFEYATRLRSGHAAWEAGFDSALLLDPNDVVCEAAHANIFVRLPDGWATPAADTGLLLPGTVRAHLLKQSPIPIRERTVTRAMLETASEVFVTNSNVGIVPVVKIDDRDYPIGPETVRLIQWLAPTGPVGNQKRVVYGRPANELLTE